MEKCIIVIGDLMLDEHYICDVERISPEAPVPILNINPDKTTISIGAAGNVASFISNAGIKCLFLYKKMQDPIQKYSNQISESFLKEKNIYTVPLYSSVVHVVTTKQRYWHEKQQVARIDIESKEFPDKNTETIWINNIIEVINDNNVGCVIFSDYNKCFLTDSIIQNVAQYCKLKNIPTVLDPKRPTFYKIRGLTIIKPNNREIKQTNLSPIKISEELLDTFLVNTLGKDGVNTYQDGSILFSIPSFINPSDVVDVTGLGDCVCAMLGLSLYKSLDIKSSVIAANFSASIAAKHKGCYVLNKKEIEQCFDYAKENK